MPPRKEMSSPTKRRPPPGAGPKGNSASGPRSPPRTSRTSPSAARNTSAGTKTGNNFTTTSGASTVIAPPPRAALSGTSSPTPDHPRNDKNSHKPKDSPRLAPNSASHNRPPSPALPVPLEQPAASSSFPSPSSKSSSSSSSSAASMGDMETVLREKDARIASLERELALMESEFHRELDKLSGAESATAAFWQSKYAALEKTLEGVLSLQQQQQRRRRQQQQKSGRDGGGRGQDKYAGSGKDDGDVDAESEHDRDRDTVRGMEMATLAKEGELREVRAAWERARDMLGKKEDEVAELRAQVRGLKEWVSHSTRADVEAQTSDEVFGEGMAKLGNGLQNWVLVNFRRAKIGECCSPPMSGAGGRRLTAADLSSADEDSISELSRLVPMYEELASASKIHLLQSIVSRLLVELVFDAYFVGLPGEAAGQIKQVEAFLSSVSSPESINQWRSFTLTMLKRDATQKLQTETSAVVEAVVSRVNKLLDSITSTNSTESRNQGLQALVNSAIELSRLLAVQKAVFRIEMPEILPHQRIMFDPETMEDIGGEDEESLMDREICCVTFPGIVKRGDQSGGHLQYRNVICKAKVLCSPE
ncbi:hypothetical protein L209DRAFT_766203 [Thermothelomyces heterothallicus CBS 203.75]